MRNVNTTIHSIKQSLQDYLDANTKRKALSNKKRDEIFITLMTDIEEIKNGRFENDLARLHAIKRRLETANDENNQLDKSGEHKGLSTQALTTALQTVSDAIAIENIQVAQARAEAAERQLREQREFEIRRQEELRRREEERRPQPLLIADPVSYITEAVEKNRTQEIDIAAVLSSLSRMEEDSAPVSLTTVQKAFYSDLEKEFSKRGLSVSDAMLYIIAQSPLAIRYGEIDNPHTLRKMIQTIGDIARIAVHENSASLQDLHHLLIAKDERALHEILSLMVDKKILTIETKRRVQTAVDKTSARDEMQAEMSALLQASVLPNQTVNMERVGDALSRVSRAPHTEVAAQSAASSREDTLNEDQLKQEMQRATHQLYHTVKFSMVISQLMNSIALNSHELLAVTRTLDQKNRHEKIEKIANELNPQFKLLIEFIERMKVNEEKLSELFSHLERLQVAVQERSDRAIDQQLQNKMTTLLMDYDKWTNTYQTAEIELNQLLSSLNGELVSDPHRGLVATEEMIIAAQKSQADRILREKIRGDIGSVMEALTLREEAKRSQKSVKTRKVQVAQSSRSMMTLEFIIKISNKFSDANSDSEPALDLISALHSKGLLTRDLQSKLLRHDNMSELLRFHDFLMESGIEINSLQLSVLWDHLEGNKDFRLLSVLHERFNLTADTLIGMFEGLSRSWDRSLRMLHHMFSDPKFGSEGAFIHIIEASKHNHLLISKLFKIYKTIVEHQPHMLADFFSTSTIHQLIESIESREIRFAEELVLRLQASDIPFKRTEDLSYVIDRTIQYDDRNLSYSNVLNRFRQNPGDYAFFDDYSRVVLGHFHQRAEYRGANQINVVHTHNDLPMSGPAIDNTDDAQWDFACRDAVYPSVDLSALKKECAYQATATHLSKEMQVLLPIIQIAIQSRGSLFMDDKDKPAYVGLISAEQVHPSDAKFMNAYLYFAIARVRDGVDALKRMIDHAKTLHRELIAEKIIQDTPFLIDLVRAEESVAAMKIVVISEAACTKLGDYQTLLQQIAGANRQMTVIAADTLRDAFELGEADSRPQIDVLSVAANRFSQFAQVADAKEKAANAAMDVTTTVRRAVQ